MIAPRRRRRSCRSRETAMIAITSEAAVMSKPRLARVAVGAAAEATTILRRARSFMSIARRQPMRSASIVCGLPCRIEASSIAASRLLAAPIAWMSPVKWRLRSSIGTTCVMPPPAAPPLTPNTGPSDGSRRQATGRLPIDAEALGQADERRRLALAGLGRRHAGDAHELAVGRPFRRSSTSRAIFAL